MSSSSDPPRPPAGRAVVGAGDVAFLDAPGMTADALFAVIERTLATMPAGAILTVYTDDPAAADEAPTRCADRALTLLATIGHDEHDGTTLAVCRRVGADGRPLRSDTFGRRVEPG